MPTSMSRGACRHEVVGGDRGVEGTEQAPLLDDVTAGEDTQSSQGLLAHLQQVPLTSCTSSSKIMIRA